MMLNLLNKKPTNELESLKIKAQHIIENSELY